MGNKPAPKENGDPFKTEDVIYAVKTRNVKLLSKLLSLGGNPNAESNYVPAINIALSYGDIKLIGLLLQYGVKLDNTTGNYADCQEEPLLIAIKNGNLAIVQMFLDAGADPTCSNSYNSSLWMATKEKRLDILETLMQYGANLHATKLWVKCPLYLACSSLACPKRRQIAVHLIKHGCYLNSSAAIITNKQYSPLYETILARDYQLLLYLVYAGIDIRTIDWSDINIHCDPTFLHFLKNLQRNPLSLKAACRILIRNILIQYSDGRSILYLIYGLNVPVGIKKVLALDVL